MQRMRSETEICNLCVISFRSICHMPILVPHVLQFQIVQYENVLRAGNVFCSLYAAEVDEKPHGGPFLEGATSTTRKRVKFLSPEFYSPRSSVNCLTFERRRRSSGSNAKATDTSFFCRPLSHYTLLPTITISYNWS